MEVGFFAICGSSVPWNLWMFTLVSVVQPDINKTRRRLTADQATNHIVKRDLPRAASCIVNLVAAASITSSGASILCMEYGVHYRIQPSISFYQAFHSHRVFRMSSSNSRPVKPRTAHRLDARDPAPLPASRYTYVYHIWQPLKWSERINNSHAEFALRYIPPLGEQRETYGPFRSLARRIAPCT